MHLKSLIILPLALLTSCISSVETVQTPIVFSPVIGNEVRSEDMSVPFPEDKSFGVWAQDIKSGTPDNSQPEYISDQEITCINGFWTSRSLPLWPATPLTFTAYSPVSLPMTYDGGVLRLEGYESGQEEILFAQSEKGLQASQGAVKLQFQHALTKLDMRIANGYGAGVQVRVDRILLTNVAQKGDFDSSRPKYWTADESSATDIVIFDSERDGEFLAEPKMKFIGDIQTIIPQALNARIELQYSFRVDEGDWIDGQKEVSESIDIFWEAGRYYTYSLTINETRLGYTTGISHWNGRENR